MRKKRHQARILALQGLYQLDIQQLPRDTDITELLESLITESPANQKAMDYAKRLTAGTWRDCDHFDRMIAGVSDHWEVSRMAVVDRNILRLALYELTAQPDVPPRVVIDEAIEIGREFGAAETPQFINGVLDAIWKQHPDFQSFRSTSNSAKETPDNKTEA